MNCSENCGNRYHVPKFPSGNMTQEPGTALLTYDAEGRIVGAGSGTYLYDGNGYRVMKSSGGTTTLYWPSSVQGVVDESNATATTFGKQVYVAGIQVYSQDTAGNGRFLFQDQLGSTRVTASAAGAVLDDLDYRSFGDIVSPNYGASPTDNHYVFTGYESDASDSTTDYAQYRNLSSVYGRFNRPDPDLGSYDFTNPQSFDRYSYVMDQPTYFVDPSGLDPPPGNCPNNGKVANCTVALPPPPQPADPVTPYMIFWGSNPGMAGYTPGITNGPGGSPGGPLRKNNVAPNNGRTTCSGTAQFTGVGGNQAMANGALYSAYPAAAGGSIKGGTFGTVAVQNGFLGLSTRQLRTYGTQIFVTPGNQSLIAQNLGPTGPLSVSDYGDAGVQASRGVAFDIYRFPTIAAGKQYGLRLNVPTTISFPTSSGGICPAGFTVVP